MKKRLTQAIDYLSSLSFTVIILIALTLTACINIMEEEIFSFLKANLPQYEPMLRSIFDFFGFSFLYQSWWFNTLLVLFSLNLLICTVKRIPKTIRSLAPFNPGTDQLLPSSLRYQETFTLNSAPREFETKLRDFLSRKWSRPLTYQNKGSSVFFSQKGRYAFLGFYLAHLGLLFILIGGIVSSAGYKGNAYIREGKKTDIVFIKEGNDKFMRKLDFSIRLDRCEVLPPAKRGDGVKRSTYRSTITLVKNGEQVKTGAVEGSLTLKYEGIRIAQLTYLEKDDVLASLSVTSENADEESRVYTLRRYESFGIPETGHTIRVKSIFSPPSSHLSERLIKASLLSPRENKKYLSSEMVMLEVYGEDNSLLDSPYVYSSRGGFERTWNEDYEFSLLGVEKSEYAVYTMLSVSYEPGANFIWISVYVSILGFAMMFLLSHRKLWVKVEERDGRYYISLAGWASRNPEMLKGSFKEIKNSLWGDADYKD